MDNQSLPKTSETPGLVKVDTSRSGPGSQSSGRTQQRSQQIQNTNQLLSPARRLDTECAGDQFKKEISPYPSVISVSDPDSINSFLIEVLHRPASESNSKAARGGIADRGTGSSPLRPRSSASYSARDTSTHTDLRIIVEDEARGSATTFKISVNSSLSSEEKEYLYRLMQQQLESFGRVDKHTD